MDSRRVGGRVVEDGLWSFVGRRAPVLFVVG